MKRLKLGICISLLLCIAVFSSAFGGVTGPHGELARYMADTSKKGVCANCHIPHYAKGRRLWKEDTSQVGFGGVRQLCYSCHDGTLTDSTANFSGIDTVFGDKYETHVMHGVANVFSSDVVTGGYDKDTFPLDPNDTDNVSRHPDDWDKGGAGFYCGSCHNPHVEPESDPNNGDYLRSISGEDVGEAGNRTPFCNQCHTTSTKEHFNSSNCGKCHHPHEGVIIAQKGQDNDTIRNNNVARLIFKANVFVSAAFRARPNVPGINDASKPLKSEDPIVINPDFIDSSYFCYGCHRPHHLIESGNDSNAWREAGAAPILGDEIDPNSLEHHPMGTEALSTGNHYSPYARGVVKFNSENELTCTSCHVNHIVEETSGYENKENNFLRNFNDEVDGFANDNARYCLFCHYDKSMSDGPNTSGSSLSIIIDHKHFRGPEDVADITSPRGKRYVYDSNPPDYVKKIDCLECMFCHFIHDGESRGTDKVAELDALMRVPAINLVWGDQLGDSDSNDYEDMCYGCHSNEDIVGGECNSGSRLKWSDNIHTHRFASIPDSDNSPYLVIFNTKNAPFPKSDGPGTDILNDYGTEAGYIFCGTCHRVHDNTVSPYLNHEDSDTEISPYEPASFCEYCHDADSGQFIHDSHPVSDLEKDVIPSDATVDEWPGLFFSGKNGCEGGITYPQSKDGSIICLTCHNVHAAATSWKGDTSSDPNNDIHGKLLVIDNFPSGSDQGSDMCINCHQF